MNYLIPLLCIEKIANPFKQLSIPGIDSLFNYAELEQLVSSGDIFEQAGDSLRLKVLRGMAYRVVNFNEEEAIGINLVNPVNVATGWLVEGIEQLGAAIYLNSTTDRPINLTAKVIGSSQLVDKLLNPIEQLNNIKNNNFDWSISEADLKSTWSNPDFVISQRQHIVLVAKYSSENLWQDKDFLNEFFTDLPYNSLVKFFEVAPREYAYSDAMADIAYENPKLGAIALLELPGMFPYSPTEIEKDKETRKSNFRYSIPSDNKNLMLIAKPCAQHDQIITKFSKLLTNPDRVTVLLKGKSVSNLVTLLPYLSEDIIYAVSESIWDIYENATTPDKKLLNIYEVFPKKYFQDKTNMVNFMKKNELYWSTKLESYPHVHSAWTGSKEKFIELVQTGTKEVQHFYQYLPEKIRYDREVVEQCIINGIPEIFMQANKRIKKDKELIELFCLHGGKISIHDIDIVKKLTNPETIKHLIKNNPRWISMVDTPIEWCENIANVMAALPSLEWEAIPEKVRSQIESDDNLAYQAIELRPNIYSKLPESMRRHERLALYILEQSGSVANYNELVNAIPKNLWAKKSFCGFAVGINPKNMEMVPPQFLLEKDFILTVFRGTKPENMHKLLTNLPDKAKLFFQTYGIETDHGEFIEKLFLKEQLEDTLVQKSKSAKKNKI